MRRSRSLSTIFNTKKVRLKLHGLDREPVGFLLFNTKKVRLKLKLLDRKLAKDLLFNTKKVRLKP